MFFWGGEGTEILMRVSQGFCLVGASFSPDIFYLSSKKVFWVCSLLLGYQHSNVRLKRSMNINKKF